MTTYILGERRKPITSSDIRIPLGFEICKRRQNGVSGKLLVLLCLPPLAEAELQVTPPRSHARLCPASPPGLICDYKYEDQCATKAACTFGKV
jgi:hypothetical protein